MSALHTHGDLIAKLEAAEAGSLELDADICILFQYGGPNSEGATNVRTDADWDGDLIYEIGSEECCCAIPPVTTSPDAALALAERVLPGCCVLVGDYKGLANHTRWNGKGEVRPTKGWCSLSPNDDACSNYRVHAHTPALALCIAILRAKEAQS